MTSRRYGTTSTTPRCASLLARKRATIVRLRNQPDIDDSLLRRLQTRLDIEEVRLSRRDVVD